MLRFTSIFIALLLNLTLYAQKTQTEKKFWLRPGVELGIAQLKNPFLIETYRNKTAVCLGASLQLGNHKERNVGGYLNYQWTIVSKYDSIKSSTNDFIRLDKNSLTLHQFILGLNFKAYQFKTINAKLKAKVGLIKPIILDEANLPTIGGAGGIQMGLRYEMPFNVSRWYIDFNYNLMRLMEGNTTQNYDLSQCTFGFVI